MGSRYKPMGMPIRFEMHFDARSRFSRRAILAGVAVVAGVGIAGRRVRRIVRRVGMADRREVAACDIAIGIMDGVVLAKIGYASQGHFGIELRPFR